MNKFQSIPRIAFLAMAFFYSPKVFAAAAPHPMAQSLAAEFKIIKESMAAGTTLVHLTPANAPRLFYRLTPSFIDEIMPSLWFSNNLSIENIEYSGSLSKGTAKIIIGYSFTHNKPDIEILLRILSRIGHLKYDIPIPFFDYTLEKFFEKITDLKFIAGIVIELGALAWNGVDFAEKLKVILSMNLKDICLGAAAKGAWGNICSFLASPLVVGIICSLAVAIVLGGIRAYFIEHKCERFAFGRYADHDGIDVYLNRKIEHLARERPIERPLLWRSVDTAWIFLGAHFMLNELEYLKLIRNGLIRTIPPQADSFRPDLAQTSVPLAQAAVFYQSIPEPADPIHANHEEPTGMAGAFA